MSLRLKRVFGKLNSSLVGTFWLSDTIETARDLEWFTDRYPLICDSTGYLKQRAGEYRERETLVASLLASPVPGPMQPLAVPARPYQDLAARLLLATGKLLLADDVGLGKTVSAIAAFVDSGLRPCLVATLANLPFQWEEFVGKFAPHLRCHILKSSKPYDLRGKGGLIGVLPDVIISSYHKLNGWAETLAPVVKCVVWDECQELRHCDTGKYNAARLFADAVPYRIGLSATPIYNYGDEIFNVLECIAPGDLGTHEEFTTEWTGRWEREIKDPRALGSYLRESGLMLRRTRAEVFRELPPLSVIPHTVESDEEALEEAGKDCATLAQLIVGRVKEEWQGQRMQASAQFDMRLRQATGIAKAPYVAAFVRLLLEEGEAVMLYGWHRAVYKIWLEHLAEFAPVMYTGSETPREKDAARQAFIRGDSRVMLISLRSGMGLDGLQGVCKTVVFGELDWSPGVHEQCTGRVFRDGQASPVFAYYLLSEGGSDPVVADVLGVKRQQIEGLNNPNAAFVERLEIDPDHVKKLAEAYLKRHRIARASVPLAVES